MPNRALKTEDKWSYADYCSWPVDERWELIDGIAYAMSPAPGRRHQEKSGEIFRQISNYLKGKNCKVYNAPFDVRLPDYPEQSDDETETVVQPDILVVCDHSKLDDKGCKGAPDIVIEILSPSTASYDMKTKFYLYQRVGVLEYWIVNISHGTVMVFKLNNSGEYGRPDMYDKNDKIEVPLLGELIVDLAEVFESD